MAAGCLTREELIARRISTRADFFTQLPEKEQERIRKGVLRPGDTQETAWIIYGEPDRKFIKVDGVTTNEIWSYADYEFDRFSHPRPIYHPVRAPNGRMFWNADYLWFTDTTYHVYEFMRIEFKNGFVKGYEEEKRAQ